MHDIEDGLRVKVIKSGYIFKIFITSFLGTWRPKISAAYLLSLELEPMESLLCSFTQKTVLESLLNLNKPKKILLWKKLLDMIKID